MKIIIYCTILVFDVFFLLIYYAIQIKNM